MPWHTYSNHSPTLCSAPTSSTTAEMESASRNGGGLPTAHNCIQQQKFESFLESMIVFTCSRLIGVIDAQIVPTEAMNKIVRVVGGTVSRDNSSQHQPLIKVYNLF